MGEQQEAGRDAFLDLAMDRYARGEDKAFEDVYDGLAPRLYGYLFRQTRNRARAEDLVQQTFLQMHRARGHFLSGAAVVPWAFAIARRLFIDGIRRSRREVIGLDDDQSAATQVATSADADPEGLARARELAEALARALEGLPETQRSAFELVKQDGLSLSEAAQVLGITVTAVKLRAHRAYVTLREKLGDAAPPEPDSLGGGAA